MSKYPTNEDLLKKYGPYIDAVEATSTWTEENHGEEFNAEEVMRKVKSNYSCLQDIMDNAIHAVHTKNKEKL